MLLLQARSCSLATGPLVDRRRSGRRLEGDRDLELEFEESGTRALGSLSAHGGVNGIGRAHGGERGVGLVRGKKGMAFDGGERERERARGGTGSVFGFRVHKKLGIAVLGSGLTGEAV